jgi:hypothetical protein
MGRHLLVMLIENIGAFSPYNTALLACDALYCPGIFCTKASLLFLYARLFPHKRFRLVCLLVGIFVAIYTGIAVIALTVPCVPLILATPDNPIASFRCSDEYLRTSLLVITSYGD